MKKTPLFLKMLAGFLVGPLAGAFGLYLLTEAPAVHAAICSVAP